jgi:hypothetical protein
MARGKVDTSKTDNVVVKQVGADLNRARDTERAAENEWEANIDYDKQQSYGLTREYEQAGPLARTDWQGAVSNNKTERSLTTKLNEEREKDPTAVEREFAGGNIVVGGSKNKTNTDGNAAAGGNENAGNSNTGGKVEVKTKTNTNNNAGNGNTGGKVEVKTKTNMNNNAGNGNTGGKVEVKTKTNTNNNAGNGNTNSNTNTNSSAGFGNLPDPKTNNVPKGYNEVQQNQVGQSSGTSESTGSQQSEGHSNGTSVKTFDAEANAAAREAGQDYVNDGPSGYQEALNELGVGEGGPKEKLLQEKLEQGIPFAQAIQEIATQGDADAKAKAEKLAKTKNTMANLMESFRLATDMASGFTGGNIYKRDGNEKIVAENKRELDAADRKYQKALDDFNNNMRRLKSEDLAEKRQRAAKLGEVGFGTETNQENTNNTNTQSHTEQQNTQTQSNNQFVQDQEYAANQSVRTAYAHGAGEREGEALQLRRYYVNPQTGKVGYVLETVPSQKFWEQSIRPYVAREFGRYLTRPEARKEGTELNNAIKQACMDFGIGDWETDDDGNVTKFEPDFDELLSIVQRGTSDKYGDKIIDDFYKTVYAEFEMTDAAVHPKGDYTTKMKPQKVELTPEGGRKGYTVAPGGTQSTEGGNANGGSNLPTTGEDAFESHQN